MASQRFYVLDTPEAQADGKIEACTGEDMGVAYNTLSPSGAFINVTLKGYWVITDEDYKLLREAKRKKK